MLGTLRDHPATGGELADALAAARASRPVEGMAQRTTIAGRGNRKFEIRRLGVGTSSVGNYRGYFER
jgi:hypothetical protein